MFDPLPAAGAPLNPWATLEMQDELDLLFGRKVDLVRKGSILNPFRLRSIQRDLTVLYAA
jgi:predicted nucleotidyltransferase